jgi:phosphohistidine phosphatase
MEVGLTVVELDLVPDLVLSSTAARARATAELAIEEGGWETQLVLEPDLYHTGVDGALAVIAGSPDVDRVMVVGHQPTWGSLVHTLTGVPAELKTATLAVVGLPISKWSEIRNASGKLAELRHPR